MVNPASAEATHTAQQFCDETGTCRFPCKQKGSVLIYYDNSFLHYSHIGGDHEKAKSTLEEIFTHTYDGYTQDDFCDTKLYLEVSIYCEDIVADRDMYLYFHNSNFESPIVYLLFLNSYQKIPGTLMKIILPLLQSWLTSGRLRPLTLKTSHLLC